MSADAARHQPRWHVRTVWAPLPGQVDGDVTCQGFDDLAAAVAQGRATSCCEGARLIEVTHPDGTLAASWARANRSLWIAEPPGPSSA